MGATLRLSLELRPLAPDLQTKQDDEDDKDDRNTDSADESRETSVPRFRQEYYEQATQKQSDSQGPAPGFRSVAKNPGPNFKEEPTCPNESDKDEAGFKLGCH